MARFTLLGRFMMVVLPWLLLTACVQSTFPTPSAKDNSPALFSDGDVDDAELALAGTVALLEGKEETPLPESIELPALSENQSDFTAQAVLPDASGFVYYIEHDPSSATEPFSIFRFDQRNDVNTKIYAGLREIQGVAGSFDGTIIALSMRETTSLTSDFEIFRFFVDTRRTQRLTDNLVDDTNIAMSGDALKLVWEQAVSGKATVVLRSYRDAVTLTDFQESFLNRNEPQRQPSLSSNGRFIVLIRDLTATRDILERFDTVTNSYLNLAGSSTSVLEHPSISNDGDKTAYLENRPNGTDLILVKTVSASTLQIVANTPRLEHPFISADGLFVTYGQLENNAIKVFTKNLSNNGKLRITNPVSSISHTGMSWQLPFASQNKLIAFDGTRDDKFGRSVAVSGSLMVIGADADRDAIGSAYLYNRNELGQWSLVKKLISSDGQRFDFFSDAVAISGDTVVVGASQSNRDVNGDGRPEFTVGLAYIFQRNQGGKDNWGEVKKLVASDANSGHNFGTSVAISNDLVIVGAIREGGGLGAAYVFGRNRGGNNNWGEIKKLTNSDRSSFQNFGATMGLSGDTAVVGAPGKDAAYIFQKDQGGTDNWGEVKKLTSSDGTGRDIFGVVAISGDVVVVGAPFEDHDTTGDGVDELDAGAAYIFGRDQGGLNNWGEVKKLIASDGAAEDTYGQAVAISGQAVVVGTPNNDNSNGNDAGAVYIDER